MLFRSSNISGAKDKSSSLDCVWNASDDRLSAERGVLDNLLRENGANTAREARNETTSTRGDAGDVNADAHEESPVMSNTFKGNGEEDDGDSIAQEEG